MKTIIHKTIGLCTPTIIALCFIIPNAIAQSIEPQPQLYIPGMPIPQFETPKEQDSTNNTPPKQQGTISKVTLANDTLKLKQNPKPQITQSENYTYKGIIPNVNEKSPTTDALPQSNNNQLAWIGFQPQENQHIIFIKTTQNATYHDLTNTNSDNIIIQIQNTKITLKNNARSIDTSYFKSPIKNAQATQKNNDIIIKISLESPQQYKISQNNDLIEILIQL